MYSGFTKMYYRKAVGYVFMKTVQIEGELKFFCSPVTCLSSRFTFLPLGDASVCSEKMAAPWGEVVLCIRISHE